MEEPTIWMGSNPHGVAFAESVHRESAMIGNVYFTNSTDSSSAVARCLERIESKVPADVQVHRPV